MCVLNLMGKNVMETFGTYGAKLVALRGSGEGRVKCTEKSVT